MKLLGKVATAHRRINSLRYPLQDRTESRGLSGEHIQLCAEGARQMPNLSGKWTEMQYRLCRAVLFWAVLLFVYSERGNKYVQ